MAWVAIALWVLGFELAPNLHLGLHDRIAPHTHGGAVAHDDHDRDHHAEHEHEHEPGRAEHGHAHDAEHGHAHHHEGGVADSHESPVHEPEFTRIAKHAAADDARAVASASRLDPSHGDHDLLHRGIAIVEPPLGQPSLAQAPVVVLARLRPLIDRLVSRVPTTARARGPPMIAATCRAVDCTI